jgi:hypothetical protein
MFAFINFSSPFILSVARSSEVEGFKENFPENPLDFGISFFKADTYAQGRTGGEDSRKTRQNKMVNVLEKSDEVS